MRHALHQAHAVDFTELLRMAVDLLDSDPDDETGGSLVRFVRDTFRYVVVDEYQDTNPVQERLIEGLCRFGANLCVVGDDDQTIYQWRGSAVSNIQQCDRRPGTQVVTLEENFRSSPAVVDLAQSVAGLNAGERLVKNMVAAGHQQYEAGDILALSFDDSEAEARWVVDRMERL